MFGGIPWQSMGVVLSPVGLYMRCFVLLKRGDLTPVVQ